MKEKKEENNNLIDNYERYLLTEKRVAKNTFDSYTLDLKQFRQFLDTSSLALSAMDSNDVKKFVHFLKEQGMGARSMARKISCIKSLYAYLNEFHHIANNAKDLILPRLEKKLPHFITEDHLDQLFDQAQQEKSTYAQRNFIMLLVLYASGIRISELVHLKKSDLDTAQGLLTIRGKGSKERLVPLPLPVTGKLQDYLQTTYKNLVTKNRQSHISAYLFPVWYKETLKPMSRQLFWLYLKKMAIAAGITHTISPHQLRHSLATHLLKKGANLRSLQLLLGHEQLSTVQIYTHIETTHLRTMYDRFHPRA